MKIDKGLKEKMGEQNRTVAAIIARFLRKQGIERIFALCGGHIMPIWMRADFEGIEIIDVRDERAAIHMAHAHAVVTGTLGVALVTAGPGVTNAVTGIANAHVSRAPIMVLSGTSPTAQTARGGLQDMNHPLLLSTITRNARTVQEPAHVLQELSEAVSKAKGDGGEPGPVFLDFPTNILRKEVPRPLDLEEYYDPKPQPAMLPSANSIMQAVDLLWSAQRPVIISGRGAMQAGPELEILLDRLGAAYVDTGESLGLISHEHPLAVGAVRAKAISEADLIVTIGRRLDFQLAYGSPAIFNDAKFVRISDCVTEVRDNRRGSSEILASIPETLAAIVENAGNRSSSVDKSWVVGLCKSHLQRTSKLKTSMESSVPAKDGLIHPNSLLGAIQETISDNAIATIDGGDFLAFARVALKAKTILDPGAFGCIGVGVPFGIAASLACPDRDVVVATGDGAFGFNAIELDTAVRHKAPILIVVANNGAWQIEVNDQQKTYGKIVGTRLQHSDYAAMARAFGMHGERVEKIEELHPSLARANHNRPALVDVVVTPNAVSADSKSGLASVPDFQPVEAWDDLERSFRSS